MGEELEGFARMLKCLQRIERGRERSKNLMKGEDFCRIS